MTLEMMNAARPLGFDFEDVTVPTSIWRGGLDVVHPSAMGRYLAEHIPNADFVFEPDYATFNFIGDFDAILATLIATLLCVDRDEYQSCPTSP
jgi:pimeloyl-ACP methyl ester carboxylesterase